MMTITEALQEIKTINARLLKKRNNSMQYIARDSRARDPFESSGGSARFIHEERQSIKDLEERLIKIRTEIQKANIANNLTVGTTTRTVTEWLIWRREIAENERDYIKGLLTAINAVRNEMQRKGGKVLTTPAAEVDLSPNALPEAVINLNERELLTLQDKLENVLGTLDGKLSLFNATATIESETCLLGARFRLSD